MFKGGDDGAKWTLLGIETAVVKGFFSEIIILEGIFLPPKMHILETSRNLKKLKKYDPQKIENWKIIGV